MLSLGGHVRPGYFFSGSDTAWSTVTHMTSKFQGGPGGVSQAQVSEQAQVSRISSNNISCFGLFSVICMFLSVLCGV